jgi:hypothetical protein
MKMHGERLDLDISVSGSRRVNVLTKKGWSKNQPSFLIY